MPPLVTDDVCVVPPPPVPASVLARHLDWAALLERVFGIDVLRCTACGGPRQVIAFLSEPSVVTASCATSTSPPFRRDWRRARPGSPQAQLSDWADELAVEPYPDS